MRRRAGSEGERAGALPSVRLRGLPLRWRVAALSSLAIALLGVAAGFIAYAVVYSGLYGDLQRSLRSDALRVADLYGRGEPGNARDLLSGPTGGVTVQLYDLTGNLLVASSPDFALPEALIPAEVVTGASGGLIDWRGELGGHRVQAALAPFGVGVAAVAADTAFIGRALTVLWRSLLLTGLLLVLLSAAVGYAVAGASIRPIRLLARQAARLGPHRLEPIHYRGPDDEVGQLARVLNDLIARLKASLDAQQHFLAETSHELRTPLTSLQGFLDRARRRAGSEVGRELDDAHRIASTMSRLVEDLLQLSRGELVQEVVPHLVDPYLDVLAPVAEEFPGVGLAGRPGEMLLGDPERLRQLVRNLVANAVRAAGGPHGVELALDVGDGRLELRVRDEGPGIPAEVLGRVFDKFYKGAGGGAGLGLAIARQIAEGHGGELGVSSRPGFTEFRLTLPALEGESGEE